MIAVLIADALDITGACDFLDTNNPGRRRLFFAAKRSHIRLHAGAGEETGGIVVQHQWRAGSHQMAAVFEEIQK